MFCFSYLNTKPRSGSGIFRPNYADNNNVDDRVQISIMHRFRPYLISAIIGLETFVNGKFTELPF